MSNHAPAPWKIHPVDDTVVIDATDREVAQIDGDYNQPDTWPIMEANARLIAAAPDLLEALKHARNQMQHPDQMIDEAIAKADGRS